MYIFFIFLFIFERERERERERESERAWVGEEQRERGRHRERGSLQALSCQDRAWRGAWTHELRDHDLSPSRMLNQLSHPGTPHVYFNWWIKSFNHSFTIMYEVHVICQELWQTTENESLAFTGLIIWRKTEKELQHSKWSSRENHRGEQSSMAHSAGPRHLGFRNAK